MGVCKTENLTKDDHRRKGLLVVAKDHGKVFQITGISRKGTWDYLISTSAYIVERGSQGTA